MRTALFNLALVATALASPVKVTNGRSSDLEDRSTGQVANQLRRHLSKLTVGETDIATRDAIAEVEADLATLSESNNALYARQTALGALIRIVLGALSSVTGLLSSSSMFDPSTALSMQSLMSQTSQQLDSMRNTLNTVPLNANKLQTESDKLSSLTTQVDDLYSNHMSELSSGDAATVTNQLQEFDDAMASIQREASLL